MSLINEMLNDLEERRDKPAPGQPELDWLQGQGAVSAPKRKSVFPYVLLLLCLLVIAVVIAGSTLDWRALISGENIPAIATISEEKPAQKPVQKPVFDPELAALQKVTALTGDKPGLRFELDQRVEFQSRQFEQRVMLRMSNVRNQLGISRLEFAAPLGPLLIKESEDGLSFELLVDKGLLSSIGQSARTDGGSIVEIQFEHPAIEAQHVKTIVEPVTEPVIAEPITKRSKPERRATTVALVKPVTSAAEIKQFVPLSNEQRDSKTRSEAKQRLTAGDNQGAEKLLEDFMAQQPLALRSGEMLASLYFSQRRFIKAQSLIDSLRDTYPADAGLLSIEARLLLLEGQADKAVSLLMAYKPDIGLHEDYYELLALATRKNEQYLLSEQVYKGLLDVNAGRGDRWVGLAIALDAQGKSSAARSAFREALKTGTTSPALADYARRRLNATAS